MRSGSVRSCPRQLPPHLEMTLVYCSRDFSTLRSLYPRQYWSLTTEGGAARNSYKCKYICCCVILVLLCLLLSQVLAFLYHLFPFSFVRRSLSSSSVCLFVLRCRRLITLRFRCLPPRYSWSLVRHNHSCDYTPIIMRAQLRTYSLLNSLIHLLLSSLCSQSATCSFLFRVILLLAVVN